VSPARRGLWTCTLDGAAALLEGGRTEVEDGGPGAAAYVGGVCRLRLHMGARADLHGRRGYQTQQSYGVCAVGSARLLSSQLSSAMAPENLFSPLLSLCFTWFCLMPCFGMTMTWCGGVVLRGAVLIALFGQRGSCVAQAL